MYPEEKVRLTGLLACVADGLFLCIPLDTGRLTVEPSIEYTDVRYGAEKLKDLTCSVLDREGRYFEECSGTIDCLLSSPSSKVTTLSLL